MKLTYLDGTYSDDSLFDHPLDIQRGYMAGYFCLSPNAPESWPLDKLDWLLAVRRVHGHEMMHKELSRMLGHDH